MSILTPSKTSLLIAGKSPSDYITVADIKSAVSADIEAIKTALLNLNPSDGNFLIKTITEYDSGGGVEVVSATLFDALVTFSLGGVFSVPNVYSSTTGIVAAGTNQGTATALTTEFNNVTTCSVSTKGVVVFTAAAGNQIIIKNSSTNDFNVYPASGAHFDSLSTNTAIVLPVGGVLVARAISATAWVTNSAVISDTVFEAGAGSAAAPAFTFLAQKDMGLYKISSTQIGIAVGGTLVGLFNTTGLATDVINEQTTDAGVTIETVLIKDGIIDTNVATAKIQISGNTIAAKGSNTDVDVNINGQGAGLVYVNGHWAVNSSGILLPNADNTYDIGNLAVNPRDITASRSEIIKGIDANAKYGQLTRTYVAAKSATLSSNSVNIAVQVPSGAKILGCSMTVSTVITSGDGATTWKAKYNTGNSTVIGTGYAFTVNTKVNVMFDSFVSSPMTTGLTDITIEPDSNNFSGGVISVVVYYEILTSITT